MKREIITTADGSSTIFLPEWNEHYHSKHGALQEALHVFIRHGFHRFTGENPGKEASILEIGFGTGLNALLTLIEAEKRKISVSYTGVEAYPVVSEEVERLNYSSISAGEDATEIFQKLHEIPWEKETQISPFFTLQKKQMFFGEISEKEEYSFIYFDAFGPRVQPELWTEEIFQKMFSGLKSGGILTTYSAKGSVRRAMQAVGFKVERLPGPPGKREMLCATKT